MMVRLAFSIMVQADADIMLIDEVLAVGDAAFAQKCMDVFYERRRIGKTIVLVTHDMATVQSLCHRALVLHDGELIYVGDPEDAALRYYRLNFAHEVADDGEAVKAPFDEDVEVEINARMVQAKLLNPAGKSVLNVEEGQPIVVELVIEAARELVEPNLVIRVVNDEHVLIFGCSQVVEQRVSAGQRIRVAAEIENRLVPGRYAIDCWIGRQWEGGARRVQGMRVIQFTVFGTGSSDGLISLSSKLRAEV